MLLWNYTSNLSCKSSKIIVHCGLMKWRPFFKRKQLLISLYAICRQIREHFLKCLAVIHMYLIYSYTTTYRLPYNGANFALKCEKNSLWGQSNGTRKTYYLHLFNWISYNLHNLNIALRIYIQKHLSYIWLAQ